MAAGDNNIKTDELTRARMEIVALKILSQALLASVAIEIDHKNVKSTLLRLQSLVFAGIDRSTFSDHQSEEIWRAGMKETIEDIFAPLLRIDA